MARRSDVLSSLRDVRYLGSHPSAPWQAEGLGLEFTSDGLRFILNRKEIGFIGWDHVEDISADSRERVEQRITATRVVLLGALAFIAKKERALSYLVVSDHAGDWMYEISGVSSVELDAALRPLRRFLMQSRHVPPLPPAPTPPPPPALPAADSVQERLERLVTLRDAGLISDDEYAERRAAILASL